MAGSARCNDSTCPGDIGRRLPWLSPWSGPAPRRRARPQAQDGRTCLRDGNAPCLAALEQDSANRAQSPRPLRNDEHANAVFPLYSALFCSIATSFPPQGRCRWAAKSAITSAAKTTARWSPARRRCANGWRGPTLPLGKCPVLMRDLLDRVVKPGLCSAGRD
jgi:hypothetical protein